MPTYSYNCPKGHDYEEVLSISEYDTATKCPKCGKTGKRVISSRQKEPSFSEKLFPYYDTGLGREVGSPKERERIMNEMGLVSKEGHRPTTRAQERRLYEQRLHMRPAR